MKKKKVIVRLPREREEKVIRKLRSRTDELFALISDLDISEDTKDCICDTIEETTNYAIAMFSIRSIPRDGLPRPWDEEKLN